MSRLNLPHGTDAKYKQEPLLYNIGPTRNASEKNEKSVLHNCRNRLHRKSTTNQMDLAGYSWPTCSKTSTTRRLSYRCRQQARSSMSFVDNAIDLSWRFFKVQSLGQSSGGKYPYLWRHPNFVTTQCRIPEKCLHAKTSSIRPVVSIQYCLPRTKRRTDRRTQDDSKSCDRHR